MIKKSVLSNTFPSVLLTQKEVRVLMHLVDTMTPETAVGFDMTQVDVADLFLKLGDAYDHIEDARGLERN